MYTTIDLDKIYFHYTDSDGEPDSEFEPEYALALLCINRVIFINERLYCNCPDVFMWGFSDLEPVEFSEIEKLYNYFIKDTVYGAAMWCIEKRNMLPISEIFEEMMKKGIWNEKLSDSNFEKNPATL